MQHFTSPRKSKVWIDLRAKGHWGQIFGAIICFIGGAIGGIMGVVVWEMILVFLFSTFLRRDLIYGILNVVDSIDIGVLILVGLFGLVPGALLGFVFAVFNQRFWGKAMFLALILGYVVELVSGYPTNLLGAVFYITCPIQAVWFGFIGAMFVKSRFGLLPSDESVSEVKNT